MNSNSISRLEFDDMVSWAVTYLLVTLAIAFITAVIVISFWPLNGYLGMTKDNLVGGIIASSLVAIYVGVITIIVSWHIDKKFGDNITNLMTQTIRSALASTLSTPSELARWIINQLETSRANTCAIGICFPDTWLVALNKEDVKDLAHSLRSAAEKGKKVLICTEEVNWNKEFLGRMLSFWSELLLSSASPPPTLYVTERKSSAMVYFTSVSSENNLNVISSAAYGFHQISKSGSDDSFFGGATIVDTSFMESVTSSFLTFVQEPLQYRGTAIVSRDEFLAGQVTGIPSTRVLMTQHLMLGIKEASLHQADSKPAIDVFHVPIEGSRFHVSLKGFHPPDVRDCAHSGDQIRDWIEKTDIFKEGNLVTVLEAGCGPGYLTRQLLKRSKSIKIIAVDNDDKSLEAFKQNQKEVERDKILVIPSSTDDLEMGYDADIGLITVEHENLQVCPVNVILVELPLVATISDRSITARELPYIDNIDEFGLPLSIGNILRKIRESTDGFCSGLISTVIVVPIISGSISEYESGIQTTQEALGSTWKCSVENTVGSQIKWPRIDLIIATHEGNVSKINE